MASVIKKGQWYYIKYYDIFGKQHMKAAKTKNKRVANELAKELSLEIAQERKNKKDLNTTPNYNIPISLLLKEYKKHFQKRASLGNITNKTVESNFSYLKTFEDFLEKNRLGEKPANRFNKKIMENYLEYLLKFKPKSGGNERLTSYGYKIRFRTLNKFFRYISDEHNFNIEINPDITKIDLPKEDNPVNSKPFCLTKEQVEYLINLPRKLKATNAEKERMMFVVLFNTAMRSGELRDFKVKDIDFKDKIIKVIGKGNKYREIPITEKLQVELKIYIVGKNKSDYVFSGQNGKLSRDYLRLLFNRYENELLKKYPDLEHIHPHISRHTAISLMLESGIAVEVVKDIAGHSNIATTMIYTHVTKNRMKEEMKKFGI